MSSSAAYPELAGTLEGLELIRPADRSRFVAAVEAGGQRGWGYCLPYLLSLNRPNKSAVFLESERDTLCLYRWTNKGAAPRLDLCFPPIPMDLTRLERALERANDFNGDRKARVLRVDERDASALVDHGDLKIKPRKQQYIFAPSLYESLDGRSLRTVRRHVAAVDEMPELRTETMVSDHVAGCRELLGLWRKRHRAQHGSSGGSGTSRKLLDMMAAGSAAGLQGQVILQHDRVIAFSFAGLIRQDLASFLDAKCDATIPGLSYYQRYRFLRALHEFGEVNDGSDAGRPGLRQIKQSFRPIAMHVEYRAVQGA